MKSVRVIPCLDVDQGRVVKGVNFIGLRDAGDPVELAARYDAAGADEVVFLDITASSDKRETITELARKVAEEVYIPFTIGGGVRSVDDARILLRAGADKVSVNSAAVHRPGLVSDLAAAFGSQCVVVAIDAKANGDNTWNVYINGGRDDVGLDVVDWATEVADLGAGEILLTSMDGDGTQKGYDLELTKSISERVPIPVIASGGAGNFFHMKEAIIEGGASAVAAASIFHFTEQTPEQAKIFLHQEGVPVRLTFKE